MSRHVIRSAAAAARGAGRRGVMTVSMGDSPWGEKARTSRAVRVGDTIHVSGTVAEGETCADQVKGCFDIIDDAIKQAGGRGLQDGNCLIGLSARVQPHTLRAASPSQATHPVRPPCTCTHPPNSGDHAHGGCGPTR